ncbi:hypothetical protein [Xanthobacter aminoxidans]|uniref:Uncharacterized protein n=1 Tax=Xanthobacter aminoxidans TaxID=186280 RepID=A0ABW6ZNR0_9HYPH
MMHVTFAHFAATFHDAIERGAFQRTPGPAAARADSLGRGLVALGRQAHRCGVELSPIDYLELRHIENLLWFGVLRTRQGLRVELERSELPRFLAPVQVLQSYVLDLPSHRTCPLEQPHPADGRLDAHFRRVIAGDSVEVSPWALRAAASFVICQCVRTEIEERVQVARVQVCEQHAYSAATLIEKLRYSEILYAMPRGRC